MKIYTFNNKLLKERPDVLRAISKSLKSLGNRIKTYQDDGVAFARVFNDDHLKYDQVGALFVYKNVTANYQLRILYAYVAESSSLIVVDYFIKQKNNKKYLSDFQKYNDCKPDEILKKSVPFAV